MSVPKICIAFLKSTITLLLIGILFTTSANAQVKVVQDGDVGIKTDMPSEALEVNGKVKINEFNLSIPNSNTALLVGQDGNLLDGGVLTTFGLGLGLLFDANGNLAIDPDQVEGNGWNLDGNNVSDDDFLGTLNSKPIKFKNRLSGSSNNRSNGEVNT